MQDRRSGAVAPSAPGETAAAPSTIPSVRRVAAAVLDAALSPQPSVTLAVEGSVIRASTTARIARAAMTVREGELVADIVTSSRGRRLLRLAPPGPAPRVPAVQETLDRFAEVMRILAQ